MTIVRAMWLAVVFSFLPAAPSFSEERVKIAYSSADASNTVWFTAHDAGLYRKQGLDDNIVRDLEKSGFIDKVYK